MGDGHAQLLGKKLGKIREIRFLENKISPASATLVKGCLKRRIWEFKEAARGGEMGFIKKKSIFPWCAARTPSSETPSHPSLNSCLLQTMSERWVLVVRLMPPARYLGRHAPTASCSLPAPLAKEGTSIWAVNPASFSSANFPLENSPRAIAHWAVTSC